MAALTQPASAPLTIDQYLHCSFDPDCDFVEGELEERNVGESEHSFLQGLLIMWFGAHRKEWEIDVLPEQRNRISETRVRVPDICITAHQMPREKVRVTPPMIAIEILSAEDRIPRVIHRLDDFLKMGIEHVWLFDPVERVAYTYTENGLKLVETARLTISNSPIYLDLIELFAALD